MPIARIEYNAQDDHFTLKYEIFDVVRARGFPVRVQLPGLEQWKVPPTIENVRYMKDNYEGDEISAIAHAMMINILAGANKPANISFPLDHPFKSQPRPYQWDALNKAYKMPEFALLMEMRTGKSFVDISLAAQYYLDGDINAWLIVLFPGAIKSTWEIQLEEHMPIPYEVMLLQPNQKQKTMNFIHTSSDKLKIFVVGVESLSNGAGPTLIAQFVQAHKTKFTIDESTCIKNPKAKTRKSEKRTRTRLCWDLGGDAVYRMIMTGTPTTQGVEDLYSQFRFLNWQIMGYKSYFAFAAKHCIMGGFEMRSIIGYEGVDNVLDKIAPYSYIISTEDAIGIPEEVYEPIYVEQSKTQKRLLAELGDPFEMATELDGDVLEVETVLERMIRYQQIVGGHFPWRQGDGFDIKPLDSNPKMEALKGFIETIPKDQKVIIWARFVPEINAICDLLSAMKESYIPYRGGMSDDERKKAQLNFMGNPGPRFWVASQQASARGVELAAASIHIFYSNSFSYDDRKQASMRTSSSHQKSKSILYVDITMNHKIDKDIVKSLRRKQSIAEYVTKTIKEKTSGYK